MKRIIALIIGTFTVVVAVAACDDRPIGFEQLPGPAKTFIKTYFPEYEVSYAVEDDDVIRPDYEVMLVNGVKMEFNHSGALHKIECSKGIAPEIIPAQIRDYVQKHYPGAGYTEYEVDRKSYEVKLTNRMEIKFNSNFHVLEIDD